MEYRELGNTGIKVSVICLGTMTYGEQNTEKEAHHQLDYAMDRGINFIDTAEMYPIPPRAETQGRTESYIGNWLINQERDKIILATKITGPGSLDYVAPDLRFRRNRIINALEKSLKRLRTGYIDLYQLHWPERKTNFFGKRGYNLHDEQWEDQFFETIDTLDTLIKAGKIRSYGLSNETPWGMHRVLTLARIHQMSPLVSIQNPYNLLNRQFEVGLAEMSIRESVGLLAYSPLAMGVLTGKYLTGKDTPFDRLNQFKQYTRYNSESCKSATQEYLRIAYEAGISFTQMALSFVTHQPFVTSNIIGATTMQQLKENIDSIDIKLERNIIKKIQSVYERIPNPAT
ncbi:MAG TPA: aldo/keto reductase [Saprospiraceae bacterium]|nr:aldo/keto reductase [Saprospiraceae bacterium]